jgi:hypothetical protein
VLDRSFKCSRPFPLFVTTLHHLIRQPSIQSVITRLPRLPRGESMAVRNNARTSAVSRSPESQPLRLSALTRVFLHTPPHSTLGHPPQLPTPTYTKPSENTVRWQLTMKHSVLVQTRALKRVSYLSCFWVCGHRVIVSHPPFRLLSKHSRWHRTLRLTYTHLLLFSSPKSLQEGYFEAASREAPQT